MPYKVTILPLNKTIEIDPADFPFQEDGKPGSILDVCLGHHIRLEHACGGNCACTTCHVIVHEGMENLSEMDDAENDRLETAEAITLTSRLGCCAVIKGDVTFEIPEYNRNFDAAKAASQKK
jgi:2Fe-2S ferredoxin